MDIKSLDFIQAGCNNHSNIISNIIQVRDALAMDREFENILWPKACFECGPKASESLFFEPRATQKPFPWIPKKPRKSKTSIDLRSWLGRF